MQGMREASGLWGAPWQYNAGRALNTPLTHGGALAGAVWGMQAAHQMPMMATYGAGGGRCLGGRAWDPYMGGTHRPADGRYMRDAC